MVLQIKEIQVEYLNLYNFTPETSRWLINKFSYKYNFPIDSHYLSFERGCALFFLLKETPDNEFPKGKWATIQFLEGELNQLALQQIAKGKE
jgi:hypothetical protein